MAGRLQEEIRQTRPFSSLEEEAFLNLVKTTDALTQRFQMDLLKPAGLSAAQYNVLRILRGAGEDGLPCGEIAGRMITRDPDMTRLLDRMESRKLVVRKRDCKDRRVVTARITSTGLQTIQQLDRPLAEMHASALRHMGTRGLHNLIELLEKARSANEKKEER